jgi:hypothetical protein
LKKYSEYIFKTVFILFFLFLITSCIGIETVIELKNENSGNVTIKYRVSKMLLKTAEIDSDSSFLPLPVEEKDFIEKADNNDTLRLLSYNREEAGDEIFITAEFSFSDIAGLNAIAGPSGSDGEKISIDKKLTRTLYRQEIYSGSGGEIDDETMQVVSDLYSSYPVKITIITPKNIKDLNIGAINSNKAEIQMTIPEILSSEEALFIELSW